jgi:outer membrane protein assembly factor BamB
MIHRILCLAFVFGLGGAVATADDWPQWQGPKRTNISTETGLLKSWPAGGPKLAWTFSELGVGYAGPAIVGDKLFIMGGVEDREWLFAIDLSSGKQLWRCEVGPLFSNDYGDGPRGTPTIEGDRVYCIGGQGNLLCADASSGERVWLKQLKGDLGGEMMSRWGYAESPLVDGDHVVCTPGGSRGALAALDKKTGDVVWRSQGVRDKASYASMVVSDFGGVREYVHLTGSGAVGVAAKDGKLLWRQNVVINPVAMIQTPIVKDEYVYATSDYDAGCVLIKLTNDGDIKSDLVYTSKKMQIHHGGIVLLDGYLYGWSGNTNRRGQWQCQNFLTGDIVWQSSAFAQPGSVTYAGDRLYCYGQKDGTVVLAEPNKAGWKEHGRFTIPKQTRIPRQKGAIWAHPVVANGKLYLRDEDLLFCYDVKE